MGNNLLLKTLLKSVMPTVQKLVESGKTDGFLQELKRKQFERLGRDLAKDESVEILVTTEDDGAEYANIVLLQDLTVTEVLWQEKLSSLITSLFNQSELT